MVVPIYWRGNQDLKALLLRGETMDRVDELQKLMEETAKGLSVMQQNQGNWAGWIIYLLEALDDTALNLNSKTDYEFTLAGLQDAISTRLRESSW
jgi:hypothetical protein